MSGGGSFPCNTITIFIVFDNLLNSAMALLFRLANAYQEQSLVPRPRGFLTDEDTLLLIVFRRFAYYSQHPQGSWHFRGLVFLW